MNDDVHSLGLRTSGEFLVRRKRKRLGVATDPGLGFYVPSSPTSVDANPSSETAEPRSASSENYGTLHDPSQLHPPMEVDNQPPPGTPPKSSGSPTPTPAPVVEVFLRKSTGGSRKRQKLKHVGFGDTPRDLSPTSHHTEDQPPPTISQPLTNAVSRRKRRARNRSSRAKAILVKGKAYRTRSQKPKAITDEIVRAALAAHVDADEETFLEDGSKPQCRLDKQGTANGLTRNASAAAQRRNLIHPSKTQPFPCEPSLGNTPVNSELGRHPRKPMTAWEGALALSKLDIQIPTSTVTPRRKGRPIQCPSPSRMRGRYPKLPLTPLSPTPMPTSRGHPVPRSRLRLQRGLPGQHTHPEVAAVPIISAEEITSPNSEPGSEHETRSNTPNPAIRAYNHDPALSYRGRARASGVAVMDPSRAEPQADSSGRRIRFSPPLAPDPECDIPDDHPVILVPNSSDPNLASRVSPDPNSRVFQSSPSPPPSPPPHLLFVQSHPRFSEGTLGYRVSAVDSDVEREPRGPDALVPPITVSTLSKTADDNGKVVPGNSRLNCGKKLKGREEAENVHQHQLGAGSPLGFQDSSGPLRGNVQDRIERQEVGPNTTMGVWEADMWQGGGARHSPAAGADIPDRVGDLKPPTPLKPCFDHLTNSARRVESEARSRLQVEVEGEEGDDQVNGTSKEVTVSTNGPPRPAPFPPLGQMLTPLGKSGPSRPGDGFRSAITRRPRRPNGGNRFRKPFQSQPPIEVESGWQNVGTSNVDVRPGGGASKSDDLSFFAGL